MKRITPDILPVFGVMLFGFCIRLYGMIVDPLINPDTIYYIQQAKAIHLGLWDEVVSCYFYLSGYPLLISCAYPIFGDWVLAGKSASLLFAVMSFIPLYLLMRRFFDSRISLICLLIFVSIPAYVDLSRYIIRGPLYWFLSLTGLYLFVRFLDEKRLIFLLFSGCCFLLGTWTRIEGVTFLITSAGFLIFYPPRRKLKNLLIFVFPLILVVCIGGGTAMILNSDSLDFIKPERVLSRPAGVLDQYNGIRDSLRLLVDDPPPGFNSYFFTRVRNLVWLLALGSLVVEIVETLFYPFTIVFLLGWIGSFRKIFHDPRNIYLLCLTVASFFVLYVQTVYDWVMNSRFVMLMLMPSFFVIGFGIEKLMDWIQSKWGFSEKKVYIGSCLVIFLAVLPKNIEADYNRDKEILQKIGHHIADTAKYRPVKIAGTFKEVRRIEFFANLNHVSASCINLENHLTMSSMQSPDYIVNHNIDYYIHKEGEPNIATLGSDSFSDCFTRLESWETSHRKRYTLYKVNHENSHCLPHALP